MEDKFTKTKAEYGKKVATGIGRGIYINVATVDKGQNGNNQYKCTILIGKEDKSALTTVREECIRVAKTAFPGVDLKTIEWPWKDGDAKPKRPGHINHIYLLAKAYATKKDGTPLNPPRTLSQDGKSAIDPKVLYNGCLVRLSVTPKSYTMPDNVTYVQPDGTRKEVTELKRGISLMLNGVQFCGDAERFAVGGDDDMFDAVESTSCASVTEEELPF